MTEDELRSTRSFSRARTERGIALAIAIVVAVLYFGLIELLMIDSSRELAQARRFRARIVAQTLAENAAELAALDMASPNTSGGSEVRLEDQQGAMVGKLMKVQGQTTTLFDLTGRGTTSGVVESVATVHIRGHIQGNHVRIDYAMHSQ
ncbi:MAG: HIG1 domain-containing protein [Acidobacteriota bacterium]|nr:HIG1 domain-containing protein [Acidobacteriota bacterium]